MNRANQILEFIASLGSRMLDSGANIERVNLMIDYVGQAYGLKNLSYFTLSTHIQVCADDENGNACTRQITVPGSNVNLEALSRLSDLAYRVSREKPAPEKLMGMLDESTKDLKQHREWALAAGQVMAIICMGIMFGGNFRDAVLIGIMVLIVRWFMRLFVRPGINKLISNIIIMFLATVIGVLVSDTGIGTNSNVVVIALIMMAIPGMQMVNSIRNLFCGNELSGFMQLWNVLIETAALGAGIYLGLVATGTKLIVLDTQLSVVTWLLISFFAAFGFSVGFEMHGIRHLVAAGFIGVFCRIILLLVSAVTGNRFVYTFAAAFIASLLGEALATKNRKPSTYYIYPAVIQLIPGNLIYYSVIAIYLGDAQMMVRDMLETAGGMIGMSLGFVLSYTLAYYFRRKILAGRRKKASKAS